MYLVEMIFISLFFLIGLFALNALQSALNKIHKRGSEKAFSAVGNLFFYYPLQYALFPKQNYEGIVFATLLTTNVVRIAYIATAVVVLQELAIFQQPLSVFTNILWMFLTGALFILISFIIGEYIPRILGNRYPYGAFAVCAPLSSVFLLATLPVTALFLLVQMLMTRSIFFENAQGYVAEAKQEIIDIIQEADLSANLDANDKKLIASVLKYHEHIAREVMVPRVDVFSLSADTTIKEAARRLEEEGYSRTPVWRNSVDNMVGILMYKDILLKYMEYEQKNNDPKILEAPIESIAKPPLYTPETKRISTLLQEFRKKQVHMAIVVDEYGGTEGIVTIEDILEQIVGEIADEYDDEEEMFVVQNDGSWIADARMNILDAEEQLGILVPQDGDYDTLGGYIFHCAGTIPSKGFVIKHEDFELEVLRSNERCVEKVRIKPIKD